MTTRSEDTRKRSRLSEVSDASHISPSSYSTSRPHDFATIELISQLPSFSSTTTTTIGDNSNNASNEFLSSEISSLKAELEHSKSMRRIDQIKSENTVSRLERHIVSLEQDAVEARDLVEEIQIRSEEDLKRVNLSRREMEVKAKDLERKCLTLQKRESAECGRDGTVLDENVLLKKKNEQLERKMCGMEEQIEGLKHELKEMDFRATMNNGGSEAKYSDPMSPQINKETTTPPILSPAKPEILKELNRIRTQHAESVRTNRQLNRKNKEVQTKLCQLVQYREMANRTGSKLNTMEAELKTVRREREILRVVEGRWEEFRRELVKNVFIDDADDGIHRNVASVGDENAPPEIATVIRQLRSLRDKLKDLELKHAAIKAQCEAANRRVRKLEKECKEQTAATEQIGADKVEMEKRTKIAETEVSFIESREKIWKRELESMRLLLATYKDQDDKEGFDGKGKQNQGKMEPGRKIESETPMEDPIVRGLQLSLNSVREERKLLNEQLTKVNEQKEEVVMERKVLQEEDTRIRMKFGQLREALLQERGKVEKAEERASEAESFLGKGFFNPETTRVLHLQDNPQSQAVEVKYEREISSLKLALEAKDVELVETQKAQSSTTPNGLIKSSGALVTVKNYPASDTLDAQKFNKRLKESFREQIGLFREGVYLITGFKIDMIADTDRPQFKVRSMFAEHEEDHLMFKWPKIKGGALPSSLDVMETELAQTLAKEKSFAFITKFNSLPAFMASVCLALFEKQTITASI